MSISLNTELRGYGLRLTFANVPKDFAGDINRTEDAGNVAWRFVAPDGTRGPIRRTMEAAQYDALAYWEDEAD